MKEENLTVILGDKNHYPKPNNDPNLPYVIGAPDFTAKSSLTLYSDFDYNLFVPVGAGVDSIVIDNKTLFPVDVYAIGEEYYHRYTFEGIYVNDAGEEYDVSLIGKAFDLHLSLSILKYAENVLSDAENAAAHPLMLNMLAYIKEGYLYSGIDDGTIEAIETLMQTYGAASAYAPEQTVTKVPQAIIEYVNGVWVSLGNTPAFKFSVAKDANITLSYVDSDGKTQSISYNAKAGEFIQLSTHMFDFTSTITIKVDGVQEAGTYDLYTYIHTVENDASEANDACLPLARALYTYAQSAIQYKENVAQ